jgi:hypothetical protein
MKKIVMALLCLGAFSGQAQTKGDVEFGVNTGYNSSSAHTRYFSADYSSGFNLGVSAAYYIDEEWSIRARLQYDKKGWDNDVFVDNLGTEWISDYTLNYMTLPITANYHFGNKNNWYLNVGPYVGFLMNAEESSHNTDVSNEYKSTDFGISMGIGVKIPVSNKLKLFFEIESQSGFSDIFDIPTDYNVQNSRTSINVGLNFLMR